MSAPNDPLLEGLKPADLLKRGLDTVKPPSGTPLDWQPPEPEVLAQLLPQYQIEALLGRGGMGAVYRGKQVALDRAVAIKLLPAELTADAEFVGRFQREARTLARMQHPGIVSIYDFGQTSQGHLYFVMEYVDGTDLHRVIHGPGLKPAQVLEIVAQVCEALQYAHSQGVMHRDIKPANVLLNQDGRAKLADFGLARPTQEDSGSFTRSNVVMGTPDYIAPEQLYGQPDHRADLFSLGVMLYEMLTGQTPRGAWSLPSQRVRVDVRLDQVVLRALQQDVSLRYQQASEMKTDVDQIRFTPPASPKAGPAQDVPAAAPARPPAGRAAPPLPKRKQKGSSMTVVAIVLPLLAAGGGWWWLAQPPDSVRPDTAAAENVDVKKEQPMNVAPPTLSQPSKTPAAATLSSPQPPATSPPVSKGVEKTTAPAPAAVPRVAWKSALIPPDLASQAAANGGWIKPLRWERTGDEVDSFTDGAVRLRYRWTEGAVFMVDLRKDRQRSVQLKIYDQGRAELNYWENGQARTSPESLDLGLIHGQEGSLEFGVIGTAAHVLINGQKLTLGGLPASWKGTISLNNALSEKAATARNVECIILDGAADPLKLLGWDRLPAVATSLSTSKEPVMPPSAQSGPPAMGAKEEPVTAQQKLDELAAQFQAAYERDFGSRLNLSVADLDSKYLVAVQRALEAASAAGGLDEAVQLREEEKRIRNKGALPSYDFETLPSSLKKLRQTYREALAKLILATKMDAQPLYDRYDAVLAAYQTELTQQRLLDDAMKVRKVREELSLLRTQNPEKQAATAAPPPNPKGTQLFDGRTLTGWRIEGDKKAFTVVGGLLKATGYKASLICTEGPWKNFELNLKVMTELQGNSGVWIHTPKNPRDSSKPGLEVQIYNGPDAQKTGSIYSIQPQNRLLARDGQWFDLKIIVQDKTIRVFINGTQVNEWTQPAGWRPPPNVPTAELGSGTIGLQSNGGLTWFRDVFIRPF